MEISSDAFTIMELVALIILSLLSIFFYAKSKEPQNTFVYNKTNTIIVLLFTLVLSCVILYNTLFDKS